MSVKLCTRLIYICLVCLFFNYNLIAQKKDTLAKKSPLKISLVRSNFVTIINEQHRGNRIGYRFFEHEPISFGKVPLSNREANIDLEQVNILLDSLENSKKTFVYQHQIEKDQFWSKQDWTYYLTPVQDGIEMLLVIETFGEGLPEYYGIQQCFRLGGKTNAEWRREIANSPAFSEYDLWDSQSAIAEKNSLTYVLRDEQWHHLPVEETTVGARTPMGLALDHLRTDGKLMSEVGPYQAAMLEPIDTGLITRTNLSESWIGGIFWQNTSHVTNHHPADCLHAIVNIGNIPPFSKKTIRGKIYWFKGNKDSLYQHYQKDFLGETIRNKLVIASCQFPVSGDISKNASWIKNQMRKAKICGADLVHFPEGALSGYAGADFTDFNTFNWDTLDIYTDAILDLAKELQLWVLLGSSHKINKDLKPYNSLYVINQNGKILHRYDKRFCTTGDLKYYSPGDHFVVFDINDIKCGLLICYDIRFPELYREYCKQEVEVLFQSFYNARHKEDCIHPKIMPVTAQARAATNYFYMSLTNSSAPYSWPCYFITPDGLIEKNLAPNEAGILISSINTTLKYYDASKPFRLDAINGKLNSGDTPPSHIQP